MAIVTKIKIKGDGTMQAGQFVEDSEAVRLNVSSEVHAAELNEVDAPVKFSKNGRITAAKFEEV